MFLPVISMGRVEGIRLEGEILGRQMFLPAIAIGRDGGISLEGEILGGQMRLPAICMGRVGECKSRGASGLSHQWQSAKSPP